MSTTEKNNTAGSGLVDSTRKFDPARITKMQELVKQLHVSDLKLKKDMEAKAKVFEKCKNRINSLEFTIEEKNKRIDELERLNRSMLLLNESIDEKEGRLKGLEEEVKSKMEELSLIESKIKELEGGCSKIEMREKEVELKMEEICLVEKKVNGWLGDVELREKALDLRERAIQEGKEKSDVLELRVLEREKELELLSGRLEKREKEVEQQEKNLDSMYLELEGRERELEQKKEKEKIRAVGITDETPGKIGVPKARMSRRHSLLLAGGNVNCASDKGSACIQKRTPAVRTSENHEKENVVSLEGTMEGEADQRNRAIAEDRPSEPNRCLQEGGIVGGTSDQSLVCSPKRGATVMPSIVKTEQPESSLARNAAILSSPTDSLPNEGTAALPSNVKTVRQGSSYARNATVLTSSNDTVKDKPLAALPLSADPVAKDVLATQSLVPKVETQEERKRKKSSTSSSTPQLPPTKVTKIRVFFGRK